MEDETWALVSAIIIGIVLFCVFLGLFSFYRKFRSKNLREKLPGEEVKVPPISESDTNLKSLIDQVWQMPLEQVAFNCNQEAHVILLLHQSLYFLFFMLSVVGLVFLVPTYLAFEEATVGFTKPETNLSFYSMPAICTVLFSLIAYGTALRFLQLALKIESKVHSDINERTVFVEGIPRSLEPAEAKEALTRKLGKFGCIKDLEVPKDYCELYKLENQIELLEKKIEHYRQYEEAYNKRPKVATQCLCFKKKDALHYLQEQTQVLEQRKRECLKGQPNNAGVAFVVFEEPTQATKALYSFFGSFDVYWSFSWFLVKADSPKNIIWENLNVDQRKMKGARLLTTAGFMVLFLFLMTPTVFLNYSGAVLDEVLGNFFLGLIEEFLPAVLLVVYQTVLLPLLISYIVKLEKQVFQTKATMSAMQKFMIFMVVHVFLVPALGMQAFEIIEAFVDDNLERFTEQMLERILDSGFFFTILVVNHAFISNGVFLVQFGRIVNIWLNKRNSVNKREKYLGYQAGEFPFPFNYSMALVVMVIGLSFSVVFPLILPFACLFFGIRYWVMKYNFLCLFYTPKKGSSSAAFVFKAMVGGIVFFQAITSAIFMLTGSVWFVVFGILVFLSSVGVYFAFWWFIDKVVAKQMPAAKTPLSPEDSYKFPIEAEDYSPEYVKS